ncbi:MAG: adenosylcobinamide-GDP ribazoletransferase [Dehalococcoidia bacterium]|jgi:adenosylcobinamide-GDP ribazoletransferase|nr:adenosylcobinamide-GDP ribazoletransferase [Dehalococcoidia bacterium]
MNNLRSLLSSPLIALEFLTPLRLRPVRQWDDRTFGQALAWYPAVGLLIGVALLLVDRGLEQLLPPAPTAALEVALLALLSGGLHLDGVADTADGLALQGDRADRLGVMSVGNIGPAGVMSLVIVLLVLWAGLASAAPPVRSAALVLAPALGRWSVAPMVVLFHPARPKGLGHALHEGAFPLAVPVATAIAAVAAAALFGPEGLVLLAVAVVASVVVAGSASRMLEGVTGDTYGAAIEVTQAAVLLSIVAAGGRGWLDPTFLT